MKLSKNDLVAVVRARLDLVDNWKGGYLANFELLVKDLDESVQALKEQAYGGLNMPYSPTQQHKPET